jgi:very-short-patch-repair endonuclease
MKRANYQRYTPRLTFTARKLRKNATLGERLLWGKLRRKQLGYRFRRQVPIEHYIVDFFCPKLELIIEVDGSSHHTEDQFFDDLRRQEYLESFGLQVVRFDDLAVKFSIDEVLDQLQYVIAQRVKELELE